MLMRPRPGEGTPAFGPRRILVPLDGTAEHEPALPTALRMARAFGADLRALLVIPTRSTVPGEQAQSARALPGTMKAVLDLAEQGSRGYLEETLARCREAGVAVSGEILRGDPVPTVVEQASAWGADLVVLASHGRRGLDALFSGSVAPRLTGLLDRPLILVKAARAAEAAREG
jgi:nucleotide-binding universal stress UspA family protein